MFGGPAMESFVGLNRAIAVFWVALVVGYQLGFESLSILLFAVFIKIVWIDLCVA